MKDRKVLNLRTHVGGLHGKTSFDAVRDKAIMEVTAVGVLVSMESSAVDLLVPYSNCTEISLEKLPKQVEPDKRGPGRPPKE